METTWDAGQPEKRNGLRASKCIEERLLTTNLVLDKTLALDVQLRIVSANLSSEFDNGKWNTCGKPEGNMDCPITCC